MIFVVVPAYNEEQSIGRVIRGLLCGTDYPDFAVAQNRGSSIPRERGIGTQIVIVDDGSTDKTGEVALREGAVVIVHEVNRGQGAALQTGNEYALSRGATAVVHFDADGQLNPEDVKKALVFMAENNLDVVLGSRVLDQRTKMPWLKRYLIMPVSRWINFVFTGVKLSDVHNGFRVLNKKALENIIITQDGMAHNSEIVAQMKKHNLKFAEFPVEVVYKEFGQGVGGGFKILADLLVNLFVGK